MYYQNTPLLEGQIQSDNPTGSLHKLLVRVAPTRLVESMVVHVRTHRLEELVGRIQTHLVEMMAISLEARCVSHFSTHRIDQMESCVPEAHLREEAVTRVETNLVGDMPGRVRVRLAGQIVGVVQPRAVDNAMRPVFAYQDGEADKANSLLLDKVHSKLAGLRKDALPTGPFGHRRAAVHVHCCCSWWSILSGQLSWGDRGDRGLCLRSVWVAFGTVQVDKAKVKIDVEVGLPECLLCCWGNKLCPGVSPGFYSSGKPS